MMGLKEKFLNTRIGSMVKESWAVSWPMTLIMLFEFFIGITDVYVAGKFGKDVQAAYGLAFQMYFIFIIIGLALSVGTASVVSRLFTSQNSDKLTNAVTSSFFMAAAAGLFFSAAGVFFGGNLVNSLDIPRQIRSSTAELVRLYSIGFLFDYILINTNDVLRSSGSIRKSLKTMTLVCVMNIALDFILAFGTPLGFNGIAIATVISLFTGMVINIFYVRKLIKGIFAVSMAMIKAILGISWPPALLQLLWQVAYFMLFLILSRLPEHNIEVMAAFTNGLKIESAIFLPAFAFNMANAVLVGNRLGKNEKENAFRAGIVTAVMGVIIVTTMTLVAMLNARSIASFLSDDNIVINESIRYIYIALVFEPVMAWGVILGGGLNGAGDTKSVMAITALSVWLARIPLSYILGIQLGLGAISVWWAMNVSIAIQTVWISKRYFSKRWIGQSALTG